MAISIPLYLVDLEVTSEIREQWETLINLHLAIESAMREHGIITESHQVTHPPMKQAHEMTAAFYWHCDVWARSTRPYIELRAKHMQLTEAYHTAIQEWRQTIQEKSSALPVQKYWGNLDTGELTPALPFLNWERQDGRASLAKRMRV